MEEVIEDDIVIDKWVDETGATVENKGLKIDHENETVDGEALFHSDDEVDREDYEGYTGNVGPNVDYWYYRTCLVIWPISFAVKFALSENHRFLTDNFKLFLSVGNF